MILREMMTEGKALKHTVMFEIGSDNIDRVADTLYWALIIMFLLNKICSLQKYKIIESVKMTTVP